MGESLALPFSFVHIDATEDESCERTEEEEEEEEEEAHHTPHENPKMPSRQKKTPVHPPLWDKGNGQRTKEDEQQLGVGWREDERSRKVRTLPRCTDVSPSKWREEREGGQKYVIPLFAHLQVLKLRQPQA